MRLGWSQQVLCFSGERTVLNYGVTVEQEFDVQEKFKFEILRISSRYGLMNSIKVVLHKKPVYNMMRATTTGSGISNLVFVPSGNNLNNQWEFLNILKSDVLAWGHEHISCALWLIHFDFAS